MSERNDARDAARYRWLRDTLHGAKAGGGVEVNDALQVYEMPSVGQEVRIYWYPDTPVGFLEVEAHTLDAAIDHAMEPERIDTSTHDQRSVLVGGVVFTDDDVELLRLFERGDPQEHIRAECADLANRIAALLPPRETEGGA